MICSFVSYYVKDHIFEIQREKCTYTVFMSLFSWNWHLKCHQDGDSPLQRDCETSGKTLVVGPPQAPPEGDAQQAALHLQTYSTCCHGKQSLEERVQLPQTTKLTTFSTPFHTPFGFHRVSLPWQQPRCIPCTGDISMLPRFISAKSSRESFTCHLLCPKEDKGGKHQKIHILQQRTKKERKNGMEGKCCPVPA